MCWIGSPFSPSSDLGVVLKISLSLIPDILLISKSYWLSFKVSPKFKYFSHPYWYYLRPTVIVLSHLELTTASQWHLCFRLSLGGVSSILWILHFKECQTLSLLLLLACLRSCLWLTWPYMIYSLWLLRPCFFFSDHTGLLTDLQQATKPPSPLFILKLEHSASRQLHGELFHFLCVFFSNVIFLANFIWPPYLKSQHSPTDISYTLSLPYKNDSF